MQGQEYEDGYRQDDGKLYPPADHHMNGWEFLQWLITYLGNGLKWTWDEHPFLSIVFFPMFIGAFIGLILVLTGHLDGASLLRYLF